MNFSITGIGTVGESISRLSTLLGAAVQSALLGDSEEPPLKRFVLPVLFAERQRGFCFGELVSEIKRMTRFQRTKLVEQFVGIGGMPVPVAIENVHLPAEKHDYGPSKRAAFYDFVSRHFDLNPSEKSGASLVSEESSIAIESHQQMRVFSKQHPRPPRALTSIVDVEQVLRSLQR